MWKMYSEKEKIKMKTGEKYCLYCLKTGNNIGRYSCKCSSDGVHKIVTKGEKDIESEAKVLDLYLLSNTYQKRISN